ncbi:MAG: nicotinate-nucleotide adenylyltransferase [Lentisphaeraceae bacterium]|nr:nicotinate-nucleotide adenylyltransferase [Lentisphaeraceae bacterium]
MSTIIEKNIPEIRKSKRFTAIFGGTFDPIHFGHLKLAEKVLEEDLADEVMFVPAGKPPHKLFKPISPAEHRLQMVKLVLDEYPDFSVSDYEIVNQRKTSYTINTLRALQAAFPERRFRLMMGMDNFLTLDSWHKYQEIISDYELIVFTRPETKKISLNKIVEKFGNKHTAKLENSIIDSLDIDISSTDIRKRVESDEDLSGLVLPSVAEYIRENGLYK